MPDNPFITGNPVPPERFINRRRELRRVTGRIRRYGQSSIIVGEPRSGKTSLLRYLHEAGENAGLYEGADARLYFRFFDVDALERDFSQADFWQRALEPLSAERAHLPEKVRNALDICRENAYATFTLESLLASMKQASLRLVLLIDEFDRLLGHATLNNAEFYGGLRALATRGNGALTLVLAARQNLGTLNVATQKFSRTGSPYFNFLEEIPVRPFGQKSAQKLLAWDGDRFTPAERRQILQYADGHPYYLQTAASALWETYEDLESEENEEENTPENRWALAFDTFYAQVSHTIADTWRLWTPAVRKVLATLALDEIPTLLGEQRFNLEPLRRKLPLYDPEIKDLSYRGFIKQAANLPAGWEISAKVMLLWIGGELLRGLRDEDQATRWLAEQGWEGIFTRKEKEQLVDAARGLVEWLPKLKGLWQLFV